MRDARCLYWRTSVKLVPVFFHLNLISSVKRERLEAGNGMGGAGGCLEMETGEFSDILLNF